MYDTELVLEILRQIRAEGQDALVFSLVNDAKDNKDDGPSQIARFGSCIVIDVVAVL